MMSHFEILKMFYYRFFPNQWSFFHTCNIAYQHPIAGYVTIGVLVS